MITDAERLVNEIREQRERTAEALALASLYKGAWDSCIAVEQAAEARVKKLEGANALAVAERADFLAARNAAESSASAVRTALRLLYDAVHGYECESFGHDVLDDAMDAARTELEKS